MSAELSVDRAKPIPEELRTYRIYCAYKIVGEDKERTVARNLKWPEAVKLQTKLQSRTEEIAKKRGEFWTSWTGHIYVIEGEWET